ncbi:hypothetical protein OG689_08995 [Kitasatospora sp. NBC_00240]|uniref:hypothetical protein n=1 Tax=Kitasatospora sp. NBC_00240 TaxID=2903567 RepID=UPI0022571621|nr:hypothetical protein [Kitasatospora sp. NBC_00240]MCX5209415.1 hypothetical protein [Kitasatospora sp. NBC_00240]
MRLPVRIPVPPRVRLRGLLTVLGAAALALASTAPAAFADRSAGTPEGAALVGWFDYGPLLDAGLPLSLVPSYGNPEPRPAY